MNMVFDSITKTTGLGLLFGLVTLLGGCGNGSATVGDWDHSHAGLYDAELSNDGRFAVISSSGDGTSFWNLEDNIRLYKWRHDDALEGQISHIAFAPNNSHVITANARTFVVWETTSGRSLGYWSVDEDIVDVAISNNARFVLLGLKDGRAMHINQASQRRLEVVAHQGERVTTVDISADGTTAATGSNDGRVMVWNTATGNEIYALKHRSRVAITRFDSSQKRLFSADDQGDAFIWELESGKKLTALNLKRGQHVITAARFSQDATKLLLGFAGRYVRLWNSTDGRLLNAWRTPNRAKGWVPQGSTVYSVAFNESESAVITQSSNGLGRAWSINPTD